MIILKALNAIIQYDPTVFHRFALSLSSSVKAFGLRKIVKYMTPGMVKEVTVSPKAPTNSNTVAMF